MERVLADISDGLAANVESASPSVVRVDACSRLEATGVAWSTDLAVTAHHVVDQEDGVRIGLPDGETPTDTFVGRDPTTDLAALRVQGGNLTPLTQAEGGQL